MQKFVPSPQLQAVNLVSKQLGGHVVLQMPLELKSHPYYFLHPDLKPSMRMSVALLVIFYFCTISGPPSSLSCWWVELVERLARSVYVFLSLFYVWSNGGALKHELIMKATVLTRAHLFFFLSTKEKIHIFLVSKTNHLTDALNPISNFPLQLYPISSIFPLYCSSPLSAEIYIWSHLCHLVWCTCIKPRHRLPDLQAKCWSNALHSTTPFAIIP